MKTLKITTDNKISIVDVDFKDFRSIQQAVGGYFETVKTRKMWDYFKAPVVMLVDEEGLRDGENSITKKIKIIWHAMMQILSASILNELQRLVLE